MSGQRGVSIIIPCHNDGRYLHEAVASVYGQDSDLPFEILIIDDASTDPETLVAFQDVQNEHSDITLIRHENNKGAAGARNSGLQRAQYDYIFPLDVDNKLSTDLELISGGRGYMDRSVAQLEEDSDVVMVHCAGRVFGTSDRPWVKWPYDERTILSRNMVDTHAMYRREEGLAVGGYNEEMSHCDDWDFAVAMLNHRHVQGLPANVVTVPEPVFLYRDRGDGTNLSVTSPSWLSVYDKMVERSPEIFEKHFGDLAHDDMLEALSSEKKSLPECISLAWRAALCDPRWAASRIVPFIKNRFHAVAESAEDSSQTDVDVSSTQDLD